MRYQAMFGSGVTLRRGIAAAVVGVACSALAHAQCEYEVVPFSGPSCQGDPGAAGPLGTNENGWICGVYHLCGSVCLAFRYKDDIGFQTLAVPPASQSLDRTASGCASDGTTVGYVKTPLGPSSWPILWSPAGGFSLLPLPPDAAFGYAIGISETGVAAGWWATDSSPEFPIIWPDPPNGPYLDLRGEIPPPFVGVVISYVNGAGDFCGFLEAVGFPPTGFIRSSAGSWYVAPTPPSWTWVEMRAVNERLVAVGRAKKPVLGVQRFVPITWQESTLTELALPTGFITGTAWGVNSVGQIIGEGAALETDPKPVIWIHGTPWFVADLLAAGPDSILLSTTRLIRDDGTIPAVAAQTRHTPFSFSAVVLHPIRTRVGDVDIDCAVDSHDIVAILDHWAETNPSGSGIGDLDGNGIVDAYDLAIVLGDWGPKQGPPRAR